MDDKFEVRDKRRVDTEGNVKEGTATPKKEAARKEEPPRAKEEARKEKKAPEPQPGREPSGEELLIPFLMNLSAMAYMAMGLGEVPTKPNLPEAKYIIDVIGALERKMKGNLTREEENSLKSLLYELRMNFAKLAAQGSAKS